MDDRSMMGRALTIIEFCLAQRYPVPLTLLSEGTGLPKPTAWRIAEDLVRRGLLDRRADGYSGGPGLVALGDRAQEQRVLRSLVTPELVELHARTNAAVWVVDVRSDTEWTLVGNVYNRTAAESRYAETWQHSPHDPAVLASALGVVAFSSRPDRAECLLAKGIPRLTPHTEVTSHRVVSAMDRARQDAGVVEHERFRLGWSCLAVPIIRAGSDRPAAVLGVVDRSPRFVADRLLRTAHTAAQALARRWPP